MDELKPITRAEQILSGVALTPITRMEWFLKKAAEGGGSGGGAISWNDLKDRPFETIPTQYELEWDGVLGDRLVVDMALVGEEGIHLVKVSDKVYAKEELLGKYVVVSNEITNKVTNNNIVERMPGCFDIVNLSVVVVYSAGELSAAIGAPDGYIENGTYFVQLSSGLYVVGIATSLERIKRLRESIYPQSKIPNLFILTLTALLPLETFMMVGII